MVNIKRQLHSLRKQHNMSQQDVVNAMSRSDIIITQSTLARYEVGASIPQPDILNWYADFFGVTMDYIFGRDVTSPKAKDSVETLESRVAREKRFEQFFKRGTEENKQLREMLRELIIKNDV